MAGHGAGEANMLQILGNTRKLQKIWRCNPFQQQAAAHFEQFMDLTDLGVCVCVGKLCIYHLKQHMLSEIAEQPSSQPSEYGSN